MKAQIFFFFYNLMCLFLIFKADFFFFFAKSNAPYLHCTSRYFWAWKSLTAGWSTMQTTGTPSSSFVTVSLTQLVTVYILSYVASTLDFPMRVKEEIEPQCAIFNTPLHLLSFYIYIYIDCVFIHLYNRKNSSGLALLVAMSPWIYSVKLTAA